MKILIIDILGEVLDLAMKLQNEGHEVRLHIRNKWDKDIGDGIISKVSAWQKYIGWADLIIFGDVGFGNLPKKLRDRGKNVIGGTAITDRMENDREFGMRLCEMSGIPVPKYHIFDSFKDGKALIAANPRKRYVFKPFGQTPREWTKVLNPETQDRVLEYLEDNMKDGKFMLQEFIQGIEMAIGGWFNGTRFVKPVLPNFEFKKLVEGDEGPNTGEMGSVLIYKDKNKLFTETLEKAEHVLSSEGYVGYVDLNCILTEKKPYALEWTTRFGYPTLLIQDEIHKDPWGTFLMSLANASTSTFRTRKNNWCVGISVVTLPWPVEVRTEKYKGIPIFIKGNDRHIHYSDVKLKNGELVTAGNIGYVAVATGHGRDLNTAIQYAQTRAGNVTVDDGYFRKDIGYRVLEQLPMIKHLGYMSK